MKHIVIVIMVICPLIIFGQDKGVFKQTTPGYYQKEILKDLNAIPFKPQSKFVVDQSKIKYSNNPSTYHPIWHHKPVSQGKTGTCWCFSTMSFYESEVQRITGREVKLSEMYIVYYEYIERAKYWVQSRGDMSLGQGSEANAVTRMIEKYGALPRKVYEGNPSTNKFYNHTNLFNEIKAYLNHIKTTNAWNEEVVVNTVKSILAHHIGTPPSIFKFNDVDYTPLTFRDKYLNFNSDDYVNFMSLMEADYYKKAEYDVPDNWWNSKDYFNIPLNDFISVINNSLEKGYGVAIGGDVSEPGLDKETQVGVIPSFDIPANLIDENARQLRFSTGSTTDDHAMHIVGKQKYKGANWYLVKDSGSGSRNCGENCKEFGYYFFREDYLKLKIMNITVHKDVAQEILAKCSE